MLKILTVAGGTVGYGHLGRCLPIYHAAIRLGVKANLIVQDFGRGNLKDIDSDIICYEWLAATSSLHLDSDDRVLIDVLSIEQELLEHFLVSCKNIFVIDDIGNLLYESCTRIDWSVKSYIHPPFSKKNHLVSPSYVPLRDALTKFPVRDVRKKVGKILITLGGSDVKNLSPKIVSFLQKRFPAIELVVLIGPGFRCEDELALLANEKVVLKKCPTDIQIAFAMEECDLAIATGGHSIYELAAAGLPTIQLQVDENQEVSKYWSDYGFSQYIGWYNSKDFFDKLLDAINYFTPVEKRSHSTLLGQKLVDGKGAMRLITDMVNIDVG